MQQSSLVVIKNKYENIQVYIANFTRKYFKNISPFSLNSVEENVSLSLLLLSCIHYAITLRTITQVQKVKSRRVNKCYLLVCKALKETIVTHEWCHII